MPKTKKITTEEIIAAIKYSLGLKSVIATDLGVSIEQVARYLERYSSVSKAYEEECSRIKDLVEAEIILKCQEGDPRILIFYAKTRMKDRCFVERSEITGAEGDSLRPDSRFGLDLSMLTDEQLRLLVGEEKK